MDWESGEVSITDVKEASDVLQTIASRFEPTSVEYRVLEICGRSLLAMAMSEQQRSFQAFAENSNLSTHIEHERSSWIEKNPMANPGQTVLIGGRLHVVVLDGNSRELVALKWPATD